MPPKRKFFHKKEKVRWTKKMEKKFIELWATFYNTKSRLIICEEIATKLAEIGYPLTALELKIKMDTVRTKYKKECSALKNSNGQSSQWHLFEDVHKMFTAHTTTQLAEKAALAAAHEMLNEQELSDSECSATEDALQKDFATINQQNVIQASPLISSKRHHSVLHGVVKRTKRVSTNKATFLMLTNLYRLGRQQLEEENKFRSDLMQLHLSVIANIQQLVQVSGNLKDTLKAATSH